MLWIGRTRVPRQEDRAGAASHEQEDIPGYLAWAETHCQLASLLKTLGDRALGFQATVILLAFPRGRGGSSYQVLP